MKNNLAICLMTCEIEHLEEWYLHHKKMGFENFFVYLDSNSIANLDNLNPKLISEIKNIKIINTSLQNGQTIQNMLYTAFCKKYSFFDYILFIDSDEYYETKTNNIQEDISILKNEYGDFNALSIYWRFYGSNPPFENRVSINEYKQWRPPHQASSLSWKTLVNPKVVKIFNNPHFPILKEGNYIDELGCKIIDGKSGSNSSEYIWLKHIFTRSRTEWQKKLNRKGWYPNNKKYTNSHILKPDFFDKYNKDFTHIDPS
ncbi:glycosyltransferase family 2 protein [Hyphomonas sp.]|jgi:hypothetical protein|uniref:glycosyltransferase family 2 protein n=1 Tax=Hyphomonas sp. TaxID=87 RepID=UPI0037BF77E8